MNFENYVKHIRYTIEYPYIYHHQDVAKNFYKVLDKIGSPDSSNDAAAFISIRLKSKCDWVIANAAANAIEFKLCKYFWGHYGKKMLKEQKTPFVPSIEHNQDRIKDHLHAIIRFKDLRTNYTHNDLEYNIKRIIGTIDEVNNKDLEFIKVRIFSFNNEYELGNTIEYLCKTSSRWYNPLAREIYNKEQLKSVKTQL